MNQGSISYGVPRYTRSAGLPCGMSTNGSDHETNSSYSPKSYISEASEVQPFTPHSVPGDICSMSNWNGYGGPSYATIKSSSPQEATSFENVADNEMSGAPQFGLGITMPSAASIGPSYNLHGLPISYDTISSYGSDFSYNQTSSPSASSWSSAGQSLTPRAPPTSSTPLNSLPTRHEASSGSDTSGELGGWSGSRANVTSQEQFQGLFHSNRVLDTPAQRKTDDEILLEGKRNGLTYKEIRRKMHVKCAESTLRGRYRSLTKARQDRVLLVILLTCAKIELLTEFVMRDLHRIDTANNYALGYDQRLAKVQWKKVADAIRAYGGSYHFGNSTCKRKWQELHPRR
ncbi:hypothetical protein BDU57DRAFT_456092 [Ampelomyces quisqualis]|uniref:Myb-like domain-containing protein n=1 Tax=Ampelomyces quisqualis TaxID=50730 RepID=A0A6A5QGZ3_AMPQU|nr:hypothetical protein BDU57DRAFT_456092 [Ampelomyces quisqualis]